MFSFIAATSTAAAEIDGAVYDSVRHPIAGALIVLSGTTSDYLVKSTRTNAKGQFHLQVSGRGEVAIAVTEGGFRPAKRAVQLGQTQHRIEIEVTLQAERALTLPLTATRQRRYRNELSSIGTNSFRFDQAAIHELPAGPNTELSQILNQAPGVSQDGYGQGQGGLHIHGENGGGIQYRLDGILLPDAVSEFGEIFSARYARSISLLTGVLPAEIGYRTEGVVDIRTKRGCGSASNSFELWGGAHATIKPSFEYDGCRGPLSYYFSGFYLQSRVGLQSPAPKSTPYHDSTRQGQLFSAITLSLAPSMRLTLLTGIAENYFQIPPTPGLAPIYDLEHIQNYPSERISESEQEQNYYEIAVLNGTLADDIDYQAALFDRYYRLDYTPDPIGDLIYNGVAPRLSESGWLNGVQADVTKPLPHGNRLGAGLYMSGESIAVDDHAFTFPATDGKQTSNAPITVADNHHRIAWLGGLYLEDEWRVSERFTIYAGLRWDLMSAAVSENQFSPRLSMVYELTRSTAIYCGYARYFKTPPFSSLTFGTVTAFRDTTATAEIPYGSDKISAERDDYFTLGIRQKLQNLNIGIDGFGQLSHEQLDLAQFAGTPLLSSLSYRRGRSWGADLTLNYQSTDLTSYLNFSYAVLQARDIAAGQFLADSTSELSYIARRWVFLDDSQEFSCSGGIAYRKWGMLFSLDGFWGSGYRRGFANTGELPPILQFNAAVERNFNMPILGRVAARITLINIFDHAYQIRNGTGIGVASPQYGPRRSLYGGLTIPLPS